MQEELGAQKAVEFADAEQKLTDAERALVEEAYARLFTFEQGCREMHARTRESRDIILLKDPRQDAPDAPEKTIQLQSLKSTFNNCVADQMDNMPEPTMLPETAQLQRVAEDMTDAVRFVLALNDYEALHRRRVEDFFHGTSVIQIVWDEDMDAGRGNIGLIRWPMEAFLWDPAAEDIQEARALIKVSWHPLSWYAAHYPDAAKYVSGEDGQHNAVGMPAAQADARLPDEPRAMLMEYWYRKYDHAHRRYTVSVAYIAGGALLGVNENVYEHGMYPFVVDVFSPIEGLPVGEGMVQELAPMMRYVNKYARYIDMNLRMSSKGRLLVSEDSGIDINEAADWSRDILQGKRVDENEIHWLQTQPFTGMVSNMMLQLQTDIKMDSGQNQFTRGETAGGVTAASAISALQEAGGKITRLRTAVLNQGFKRICEMIMWLMAQFYDDTRMRMITGARGEPKQVDMSGAHLFGREPGQAHESGRAAPPPPYSVQVQVSRRNPLRVQAQNELFMQAYSMAAQAQAPFPLTVLFELLNVDGKDRILPVIAENEQATRQAAQLQAQNEQLQAQLEQQSAETVKLRQMNEAYAAEIGGGMYTGEAADVTQVPDAVMDKPE